ncbi:condensation domain-containing protein [Kitasatospora brasiliensis]|uniref:condensation domain-containing protein n=1 Tax=Kitasatospora brasiliensis TaxID=3058040 RepID=UPI0029301FEE|nr:condensation domain-containing protein [Kitasatospora sp. K002]
MTAHLPAPGSPASAGPTADLAARARLEAALLARRTRAPRTGVPRLPRGPGENEYPTAPIQRFLWDAHHADPGRNIWVVLGGVRVTGRLDLTALQRAFDLVVERHEALRTLYRTTPDGELLQVVQPAANYRVALRLHEMTDRQDEQELAAVLSGRFDLERGPVIRLDVLPLSEQEHDLALVLHHIAGDGATVHLIAEELAAAYSSFAADGAAPPLPAIGVQPADIAAWRSARLTTARRRELLDYWTGRLADLRLPAPPADRTPAAVLDTRGRTHQLRLSDTTLQALRRIGAEHSASLFLVTLAAFYVLLVRYSGQRANTVAAPVSYRDQPEFHRPAGALFDLMLLHTELTGDPRFVEVLAQVRDRTVDDFEHAELPYPEVVAALGYRPEDSHGLLQQVLFTEETDAGVPLPAGHALAGEVISAPPWHHALRPLTVRVTGRPGSTHIVVTHRLDRFSEQRARNIAADFVDLLDLIATDPTVRVLGSPALPALRAR